MKAMTDSQRAARDFLSDNYGGVNPSLADIIRAKTLKVSKRVISPRILGNSFGSIELESADGGLSEDTDVLAKALFANIKTMCSQVGVSHILLHFDELDQGLGNLDERRKEMLTGLILAIRSIRSDDIGSLIFPVFYIRTDIWDQLNFSDKNKISQTSAVFLEWDSETLQEMVVERIKAKLGPDKSWIDIDDEKLMRGSQSKWSHIVARTFLRPRDVIQFLNHALEIAIKLVPGSDYFDNDDIQKAREPYSKYLKQELNDEVTPHWDRWTEALQTFSEIATMTFSRDRFDEVYSRRKSAKNDVDADEALAILYSFSVIGYRKGIGKGGSGWVFQYTDPDAGWDSATSRIKVHPGLKEIAKLREERS